MEHVRARSRNGASMQMFKFPRSPKPLPSAPVQLPLQRPPPARQPPVHFDFGRLPAPRSEPRREWLAGMRKRRSLLLMAVVLAITVLYLTRGGEPEAPTAPPRAAFVQQTVPPPAGPPRVAQKVQIGAPVVEPVEEKSSLQLSDQPAWVLAGPASRLPKCEKILLYTFKPWWGFGSEYLLYVSSPQPVTCRGRTDLRPFSEQLRAAALATKLGYTLVEDDSKW